MIAFHGTTRRNAAGIYQNGFIPKVSNGHVWFTRQKKYARRVAQRKASQIGSGAIVLACNLDLEILRQELGSDRVRLRNNNIVTIQGRVPSSVLISQQPVEIVPDPEDLAHWVNQILGLKPHQGVSKSHPGLDRLVRWIRHRVDSNPKAKLKEQEILQRARQWLPKYFKDFTGEIKRSAEPERIPVISAQVLPKAAAGDKRKQKAQTRKRERAIDGLTSNSPKRRIKSLSVLSRLQDVDLIDWCLKLIEDTSTPVRVAALEALRQCESVDTSLLKSFATSDNIHIRAAAVSTLTRHAGADVPKWFHTGLTDPSPHVRVHTARYLNDLDSVHHHSILELARQDANPNIVRIAEQCVAQNQDHEEPEKS